MPPQHTPGPVRPPHLMGTNRLLVVLTCMSLDYREVELTCSLASPAPTSAVTCSINYPPIWLVLFSLMFNSWWFTYFHDTPSASWHHMTVFDVSDSPVS